jgi:hypothetical protein
MTSSNPPLPRGSAGRRRRALGLVLAAAALGLSAAGRPATEDPKKDDPVLPEDLFPDDPLRKELLELFHEVERSLEGIDLRLNAAGAGEVGLSAVEDSGLDELLRGTRAESDGVVRDIDRILAIARELGGTSMSSSMAGGETPSEGESPLDQARDRGPLGKEETPEAPEGDPQSSRPADEPGGDQEPTSPLRDSDDGENRPGEPQGQEGGPAVPVDPDAERWGDLPVRVRDLFRNQGGRDTPIQYRDWIDSYYRRLSERR